MSSPNTSFKDFETLGKSGRVKESLAELSTTSNRKRKQSPNQVFAGASDDVSKTTNKDMTAPKRHRFECEKCRKGFKYPSDFLLHEETHSTILAYKCSMCDKRFKTKGTLSQHENKTKIHRKQRPIMSIKRLTRAALLEKENSLRNQPRQELQFPAALGNSRVEEDSLKESTGAGFDFGHEKKNSSERPISNELPAAPKLAEFSENLPPSGIVFPEGYQQGPYFGGMFPPQNYEQFGFPPNFQFSFGFPTFQNMFAQPFQNYNFQGGIPMSQVAPHNAYFPGSMYPSAQTYQGT